MFSFLNLSESASQDLALWLKSAVIFALIFSVGFLFKKYVAKFIQKILSKLGLILSDETILMSARYISFWFFLVALYMAFITAPVNHKNDIIIKMFYAVFAFSVVLLIANIFTKALKKSVSDTISSNIIKFTIIFIGVILILNQIGVKLTPILTALGVGTLAVALALQDTLGNFFAGMNIHASNQIRRGDYIRLDSGQEGTVVEINWRTTRIRELSNTIITVPNTKIASAVITQFHFKRAEVTVTINCGVAYGSDLDKVEKNAVEVASEVLNEFDGGIKAFTPIVRFTQFADSSINFVLIFRVQDIYVKGFFVHEIIKRLKKRFEQENIEIPFPQRTVYLKNN